MAESFDAVLATDELVSALAERRTPETHGDPVIEALASLVEFADAPVVSSSPVTRPAVAGRRTLRGRRRLGLAIGVALACTSSGIAAAVTGDPLSPVTFVARHLVMLGHDLRVDRSSSPPDRQLVLTHDRVGIAPQRADPPQVDAVEHRHSPAERAAAPQDPATPRELPSVHASRRDQAPPPVVVPPVVVQRQVPPPIVAPQQVPPPGVVPQQVPPPVVVPPVVVQRQVPPPVVAPQQVPRVDERDQNHHPVLARHTSAAEPEPPSQRTSTPPPVATRELDPFAEPTAIDDPGAGNRQAPEPDPAEAPEPGPAEAPEPDPAEAPEPDPAEAPEPDPAPAPDSDPVPAPEPDPAPAPEPPGPIIVWAPGHGPDAPHPSPGPPPYPCQTPDSPGGRPDCAPGSPEHRGHGGSKPGRTAAEAPVTDDRTVR